MTTMVSEIIIKMIDIIVIMIVIMMTTTTMIIIMIFIEMTITVKQC